LENLWDTNVLPVESFLDDILRWDFASFREGIFFLVFGNFREGIFAINHPPRSRAIKMARRPRKSGEPCAQTETQWGGIMYEEPAAAPGMGCVSRIAYFASTSGRISAMCCTWLERFWQSLFAAEFSNSATFPVMTVMRLAMLVF
jgi:hypothetical protein